MPIIQPLQTTQKKNRNCRDWTTNLLCCTLVWRPVTMPHTHLEPIYITRDFVHTVFEINICPHWWHSLLWPFSSLPSRAEKGKHFIWDLLSHYTTEIELLQSSWKSCKLRPNKKINFHKVFCSFSKLLSYFHQQKLSQKEEQQDLTVKWTVTLENLFLNWTIHKSERLTGHSNTKKAMIRYCS